MHYYLQIVFNIIEFYGSPVLLRVALTVILFVKWVGGKIFAFEENS